MEAAQFTFKTDAFVDPPEKLKENVNGLAGHALATWISAEARKRGFEVSPVWAEDHGWDFSVAHGGVKYLCACIIQDDEAGVREGGVVVEKTRSFMDRVLRRNALAADDPVIAAMRAALGADASIRELTEE